MLPRLKFGRSRGRVDSSLESPAARVLVHPQTIAKLDREKVEDELTEVRGK